MNRFNFAFAPPAAALHAPPPAQPDAIDLAGPAAWCADIPFRGESAPLPLKSTQLPYRATNMTNVLRRLEPFTHPRDGTPLELAPIDPAVVATPFTTVMYGMPEVCVDARNARDWVMGEAAAAGFEGAEPMFVGGEKAKYGGKTGELMLGYAVVGFETRRAARVRPTSEPALLRLSAADSSFAGFCAGGVFSRSGWTRRDFCGVRPDRTSLAAESSECR